MPARLGQTQEHGVAGAFDKFATRLLVGRGTVGVGRVGWSALAGVRFNTALQ
jgi:hypothetical protein